MNAERPTSLGEMYESSVHAPLMPDMSGTIGSAYEMWLEADQEHQWLESLEERRTHASGDETTVIPQSQIADYTARREAEKSWTSADDAAAAPVDGSPTSPAEVSAPGVDAGKVEDARQRAQDADGGTSSVLRSSAVMAAGTLVSRVLGLLRSILTVAALGATGALANTWNVANSLPNIIYLLLAGGVINAVLVPQITRALNHSDGGKAYTDRIVTLSLMLLGGVTAVFMLASPWVYRIYDNNNMTADKSHVALVFTLICLPQIFFYGVYTILGQILNARGRFGAFMWSPALANVVIIAGLVLFIAKYPHGSDVLSFGDWSIPMMLVLAMPATLGIMLQAVVLIPVLRNAGYTFTPNFQFRGVGLRSASTMAGWAFAAVILQQIGLIITTQLLNGQPAGSPGSNAQSQAMLLFTLPHSLITLSLITALFTRMSVAASHNETHKVKADMTTGIRLSGLASVMLTFGSFALVLPFVGAMFGGTTNDRWAIGSIAIAMLVGLVPYSLCLIIQRVFYAYNDAKTPFYMQVFATSVAIGLTVPWFWARNGEIFGHHGTYWVGVGVGLAQTISNIIQAAIGWVLLRRKIGPVPMHETVRTYVRLAIAAIVSTAVAWPIVHFLSNALGPGRFNSMIVVAVAGGIFLVLYFGIAIRLRVDEVNRLLGPVTRRLKLSRA